MWNRLEAWLHPRHDMERVECLKSLQVSVRATCQVGQRFTTFGRGPLPVEDPICQALCLSIDECLLHGWKGGSGGPSSSWPVQIPILLPQIQTIQGQRRAWIRYGLMNPGELQRGLVLLLNSEMYENWALVKCPDSSHALSSLFTRLFSVSFHFTLDDLSLDQNVHWTKLSPSLYDDVYNRPISPASLFGVSLSQLILQKKSCLYARLHPRLAIPHLVHTCIVALMSGHTHDLFSKHVPQGIIDKAKVYIETHGKIQDTGDVHLIGALLLSFLRQLPEPLLTDAKHSAFLACRDLPPDTMVRNLSCLLLDLPPSHLPTMRALLTLWAYLIETSSTMITTLAVAFAPCILRPALHSGTVTFAVQQTQDFRLVAIGSGVMEGIILHSSVLAQAIEMELQPFHTELKHITTRLEKLHVLGNEKINVISHVNYFKDLWKAFSSHRVQSTRHAEALPVVDWNEMKEERFSLQDSIWSYYGFRPNEQGEDLEGSGVLVLHFLHYFVKRFPIEALQILSTRSSKNESNYSVPFVSMRITQLLLQLISPVELETLSITRYWTLLHQEDAMEQLFGFALLVFEHNWRSSKSTQVENVLDDTNEQVHWLLDRNPVSIDELWRLWLEVRRQAIESQSQQRSTNASSLKSSSSSMKSSHENTDWQQTVKGVGGMSTITGGTVLLHPSPIKTSTIGPVLRTSSNLLSKNHILSLWKELPMSVQVQDWHLLYRLSDHGSSLHTLLTLVCRASPSIVVLQRVGERKDTIGGFTSSAWHTTQHYYGNGESFVFHCDDDEKEDEKGKFQAYHWSQANTYFMLCTENTGISMGGGGDFAWSVDADLQYGTTGPCDTFSSPALFPSTTSFEIGEIEIWGFVPCLFD